MDKAVKDFIGGMGLLRQETEELSLIYTELEEKSNE